MLRMRRKIALLVAAAMAFAMAFSVLFIVHEAEHHCTGVDCQVCHAVNTCLQLLDNTTPKPERHTLHAAAVFMLIAVLGTLCSAADNSTLVKLKVKLSD